MKLPRCAEAYASLRKVTAYLLATDHPVGGPKARYFVSRGYILEDPRRFEDAVKDLACSGTVTKTESSRWGTKYVVEGELSAPDGRPMRLCTVWMIKGDQAPQLITAYPT